MEACLKSSYGTKPSLKYWKNQFILFIVGFAIFGEKARPGFSDKICLVSTALFSRARGEKNLPGMHCVNFLWTFPVFVKIHLHRESDR